ncbi:hypothetical protein ABS217_19980, partial [Acinetobacter baumannii]
MAAEVPPLRKRPIATMKDMGMGGMDHGAMAGAAATPGADDCPPEHAAMGHCTPAAGGAAEAGGGMAGMDHSMRDFAVA